MNTRGSAGDNLALWYLAYFIFGVLFFSIVFYWLSSYSNGEALMEDFYAKELARILNAARPGDDIYLDVTEATALAFDNGLAKENIFYFDTGRRAVEVRLTPRSHTRFSYFNEVAVEEGYAVELVSGSQTTNRLHFVVRAAGGRL